MSKPSGGLGAWLPAQKPLTQAEVNSAVYHEAPLFGLARDIEAVRFTRTLPPESWLSRTISRLRRRVGYWLLGDDV